MRLVLTSLLVITVGMSACHSHVSLKRTHATASLRERQAAYKRLSPAGTNHNGPVVDESTDSLVLHTGDTVHHPEDFLQVIDSKTAAGRAAKQAARSGSRKWYFLIAGSLATFSSLAFLPTPEGGDGNPQLAALAFFGGLALSLTGAYYSFDERQEKRAAFATYGASLRESLNLCLRGDRLVDCHSEGEAAAIIRRSQRATQLDQARESGQAASNARGTPAGGANAPVGNAAVGTTKLTKNVDPASGLVIETFSYAASTPITVKVTTKWTSEDTLSGPITLSVISQRAEGHIFSEDSILVLVANEGAPNILESRWAANQLAGGTHESVSAQLTPGQFLDYVGDLGSLRLKVATLDVTLPDAALSKLRGFAEHVEKRLPPEM